MITLQGKTNFNFLYKKRVSEYSKSGVGVDFTQQVDSILQDQYVHTVHTVHTASCTPTQRRSVCEICAIRVTIFETFVLSLYVTLNSFSDTL